ncbi:hypothetical protein J6590_080612 [Homalodisca vitripennis]|nr:hypothetical protein J6590_080612 [Homalodisca vitripennis]
MKLPSASPGALYPQKPPQQLGLTIGRTSVNLSTTFPFTSRRINYFKSFSFLSTLCKSRVLYLTEAPQQLSHYRQL